MFSYYSDAPSDSLAEEFSGSDPWSSSHTLPSGFRLGSYVIETCIGQGAMANVYRARHRVLNKPLALKAMAPELVANVEARRRFLAEACASAAIQHPNVVSVVDAGVIDGIPYLAMELLDGENLAQHLERHGRLSVEQLIAIALPLLSALMATHRAGVIHRDLKPANIFLARGADGRIVPKLLDFGVSKLKDALRPLDVEDTALNQLIGSPSYFSPEVQQGSRALTERSDQYSFGVVLYECITGQVPFAESELVPLLEAISIGACVGPRTLVPSMPERLECVILRAMSVDPAKRFEDLRDLACELLEFAGAAGQQNGLLVGDSGSAKLGLLSSLARPPALSRFIAALSAGRLRRVSRQWRRPLLGAMGIAMLVLAVVLGLH